MKIEERPRRRLLLVGRFKLNPTFFSLPLLSDCDDGAADGADRSDAGERRQGALQTDPPTERRKERVLVLSIDGVHFSKANSRHLHSTYT